MSKTHKYISKKIILTNKKYKFHPYFEIPLKRVEESQRNL